MSIDAFGQQQTFDAAIDRLTLPVRSEQELAEDLLDCTGPEPLRTWLAGNLGECARPNPERWEGQPPHPCRSQAAASQA